LIDQNANRLNALAQKAKKEHLLKQMLDFAVTFRRTTVEQNDIQQNNLKEKCLS
jgi:hypothetical protein